MPTTNTGTQVYLTYDEMRHLRDAHMRHVWGEVESEYLTHADIDALDKKLEAAQNRVLDKRVEGSQMPSDAQVAKLAMDLTRSPQ
jgi:hypothetical protein